ncbi:hypothetical protein HGRIS_004599 [Hohenbuehelia grisea]|uniref:Sugar phosphate transporter domain-containing protein n=1 Tax=Hohenbuehelia grisea TaxID=104357 RepID=A0ABR3JCT3_9AGAR
MAYDAYSIDYMDRRDLDKANSAWRAHSYSMASYGSSLDEKYSSHLPNPLVARAGKVFRSLKRSVFQAWTDLPSQRPTLSSTRSSAGVASAPSPASSNLIFILLCSFWYTTSALSSNTGKSIMTQFRYPITLTFVQFGFVAAYCLLFMSPAVRFTKFRPPTLAIIRSTLPMGVFQVGGHIFSSIAISRIPVSTVHTIKALSPLFTVAAYALLFGVSYSGKTYMSLMPLTIGVMLACSFDMTASNAVGLLCAFGSAIVFVTSNIFFKKIMPSGSQQSSHKLDKLNLLLYSSSMAFILMIPVWIYYDLPLLMAARNNPAHVAHPNRGHSTPHSVTYYFFMNGTVHFAQNLIAFIILSSTSPVTYSIASLIKRVAVICIAIAWFSQPVHPIQGCGILLTFAGLYMYNNAKSDVERGEKKMRRVEAAHNLMLPTTKSEENLLMDGVASITPPRDDPVVAETSGTEHVAQTYGRPRTASIAAAAHSHWYDNHPHPRGNAHSHPANPPNLSIATTPVSPPPRKSSTPKESYPSPPPSLDSPPSPSVPLGYDSSTRFTHPQEPYQ